MPHIIRDAATSGRRWYTRLAALTLLLVLTTGFFVAVVQPRIYQWGATEAERARRWPGDSLVSSPTYVWTNAVSVDVPADRVWPWVAQLGQGRAGLYSYDWLENALFCDVHSVNRILPAEQRPLEVGARAVRMCRYAPSNPVALYVPGVALVLAHPSAATADLKQGTSTSTWAFIVEPEGRDASRFIVRSRGNGVGEQVQGPIQFVMQRRMMQGVVERAEGTWAPRARDVIEPLTWFVAGALVVASAVRVIALPRDWVRWYALTASGVAVVLVLLFWQPPLLLSLGLTTLLVAAGVHLLRGTTIVQG